MDALAGSDCGWALESVDTAVLQSLNGPMVAISINKDNQTLSRIIISEFKNMADRIESMSILVAVVDAGSFSKAARQLKMPLATVSRKVGELEAHLKTRLLHRSTRQLSLTEVGASYVAARRRILEEVGDTERAATGEYASPKGELALTTPLVFGRMHLLPVVAEFLKAYPDIDVCIGTTRRVVRASPAYFAEHGVPKKPRDLSGNACITLEQIASR